MPRAQAHDQADIACSADTPEAHAALTRIMDKGDSEQLRIVATDARADDLRARAVEALSSLDKRPDLADYLCNSVLKREYSPSVRAAALTSMIAVAPDRALPLIVDLIQPGDDLEGRAWGATLLARDEFRSVQFSDEVVLQLYRDMVWQHDERITAPIATALSAHGEPVSKLNALLQVLTSSDWLMRGGLDTDCAARSLGVADGEAARSRAIDTIVSTVREYRGDERMTDLLAGLLVSMAGGRERAAIQVEKVVERHAIPEPEVRCLRIDIGGPRAMKPIIEVIESDFSKPLDALYAKALSDWSDATKAALSGFRTRMIMSGIVFAVGIAITCISVWQFIFGGKGDQMYGPGISLAAGLATMLTVIYRGPLADVRRSVVDLADNDIGFIAFMHKLQFTAGLIEQKYAHGLLSQSTLEHADRLLARATENWTKMVHASFEETDGEPRANVDGQRGGEQTKVASQPGAQTPAGS